MDDWNIFLKFFTKEIWRSEKISIYLWRGMRTGKRDRAAAHEAEIGIGEPAATHTPKQYAAMAHIRFRP